jgi:hypothetical protein
MDYIKQLGDIKYLDLIVSLVLGMILQVIVIYITDYFKSLNGGWHGKWYEIIPEQHDIEERIDVIRIRQNGSLLTGTARRIYPGNEKKRIYKFSGYSDGERMVGFFYLINQKLDPSSYIPITLIRDRNKRHGAVWRGSYTWPAHSTEGEIINGVMKTGFVWWQRESPKANKAYKTIKEIQGSCEHSSEVKALPKRESVSSRIKKIFEH